MKGPNFRLRASLLFSILGILFFLIVGKSVWMHLHPDPRLVKAAKSKKSFASRQEKKTFLQSRGSIRDREGRDLARSLIVKSFFANPKQVEKPRTVAKKLAPLLKVKRSKLEKLLKSDRYFVWLKREVNARTAKKIEALNIQGLYSRKESKRVYPNGKLARSVVGLSGRDGTGLEGVERSYDRFLKIEDEVSSTGVRDALGRLLLFKDFDREWFDGADVILTLDLRLQRILEDELSKTLKEKNSISAQGVMINPHTGAIMAMASIDGKRAEKTHFRNRVVSDVYEPGSTFKVILAASGMEHLGMTAKSLVFGENGKLRIGNRTIREYNSRKFGWMTLQEILEVSSNVAAAKVGLSLGKHRFEKTIRELGFGGKTGIDLPGEGGGIVRSVGSWKPIDLANISFGQGIAVTPIQMVRAFASIANGGILVTPHLVEKIVIQDGNRKEKILWKPELETREVLSAENTRGLAEMLVEVTAKGSTGVKASIKGYSVAGKTGTSQKLIRKELPSGKVKSTYSNEHSIVSFAGFVPAYDPAFVLLVLYDDPEGRSSGGNTAAPSFQRIARKSLGVLAVGPYSKPNRSTRSQAKALNSPKPGQKGQFVGKSFGEVLKEVRLWEEKQRDYVNLVGTGTAVREEMDGGRLNVYFE